MTAIHSISSRPFEPGTTGWTVDDIESPALRKHWEAGHYEIVEGVLATMPSAYLDGTRPLYRLVRMVDRHLEGIGIDADFNFEPDLVLSRTRVVRPDVALMMPADWKKQRAMQEVTRRGVILGRLLVRPTLIIESASPDHEAHDEVTKREWYAKRKVRNYWILNAYERSLRCLVLDGSTYRVECAGRSRSQLRPAAFPGLIIPLGRVWGT